MGTLTLAGTNSYGGATIVQSGTLVVADGGALPAGTSLIIGGTPVRGGDGDDRGQRCQRQSAERPSAAFPLAVTEPAVSTATVFIAAAPPPAIVSPPLAIPRRGLTESDVLATMKGAFASEYLDDAGQGRIRDARRAEFPRFPATITRLA